MLHRLLAWARRTADRHAVLIAFSVVAVTFVVAVAGVRWEAANRDEAVNAAAAERRAQICTESRNLRALVSELIDTAVGEGSSEGLPLTTLPSFGALPESVQVYLRELAAASASSDEGEPDLATRLRAFQAARLGSLPEFCTHPAYAGP